MLIICVWFWCIYYKMSNIVIQPTKTQYIPPVCIFFYCSLILTK